MIKSAPVGILKQVTRDGVFINDLPHLEPISYTPDRSLFDHIADEVFTDDDWYPLPWQKDNG